MHSHFHHYPGWKKWGAIEFFRPTNVEQEWRGQVKAVNARHYQDLTEGFGALH
jgi:hypothetical protein